MYWKAVVIMAQDDEEFDVEFAELVIGPLRIFPGITALRMFRMFLAEVGLA